MNKAKMRIQKRNISQSQILSLSNSNITLKNKNNATGMLNLYITSIFKQINHDTKKASFPQIKRSKINNSLSISQSQFQQSIIMNNNNNNSATCHSLFNSQSLKHFNQSFINNRQKQIKLLKVNSSFNNKCFLLKKDNSFSNRTSIEKGKQTVNHICLKEKKRNMKYYKPLFCNVNDGNSWVSKVCNNSNQMKAVYNMCRYDLQRMTKLIILKQKKHE